MFASTRQHNKNRKRKRKRKRKKEKERSVKNNTMEDPLEFLTEVCSFDKIYLKRRKKELKFFFLIFSSLLSE